MAAVTKALPAPYHTASIEALTPDSADYFDCFNADIKSG